MQSTRIIVISQGRSTLLCQREVRELSYASPMSTDHTYPAEDV